MSTSPGVLPDLLREVERRDCQGDQHAHRTGDGCMVVDEREAPHLKGQGSDAKEDVEHLFGEIRVDYVFVVGLEGS